MFANIVKGHSQLQMDEQHTPRRIFKNLLKDAICLNCKWGFTKSGFWKPEKNQKVSKCGITGVDIVETDTCELFEDENGDMTREELTQRINGEWYK